MTISPGEREALLSGFPDEEDDGKAPISETLTPEVIQPKTAAKVNPLLAGNPLVAGGEKIVRGRFPGLEVVHYRFAQLFKQTLSRALGSTVEIVVRGTKVTPFGAYIRMLPNPSSIYLYKMRPLNGLAAFVPGQRLVFTLVEALLGGGGGLNKTMENRELTEIEHRMFDPLINDALTDLTEAWQDVFKIGARFSHLEVKPERATLALPKDPVVVSIYDASIGQESHAFTLCEPLSVLAPIRKRLERMVPGM